MTDFRFLSLSLANTHYPDPTKSVTRLLLGDFLRLLQMNNAKEEDVLYTEAELRACMDKVGIMYDGFK